MNEDANQNYYKQEAKTMMKSRLHVISSNEALSVFLRQHDLFTCFRTALSAHLGLNGRPWQESYLLLCLHPALLPNYGLTCSMPIGWTCCARMLVI